MFRKAPLANFPGRFMHEDRWIGWNPIMRAHVLLSDRLVSEGAL
jgi:hypothetical protein